MKILALDLSTAEGSVAIAAENKILFSRKLITPRGRGAEIFSALEECRSAWDGVTRIAIGIGPGSYNGLRTSCALAESFRHALNIEVVAVHSPCLLPVRETEYIAVGDARGGMVYWAVVKNHQISQKIHLLTYDDFHRSVASAPSSIYRVGTIPHAEKLPLATPDAAVLAQLASSLKPLPPAPITPLYLKPPHITTPRPTHV